MAKASFNTRSGDKLLEIQLQTCSLLPSAFLQRVFKRCETQVYTEQAGSKSTVLEVGARNTSQQTPLDVHTLCHLFFFGLA